MGDGGCRQAQPALGRKMRLTILGGGPAGLAVAYYAHRRGLPFALYEKQPHLGGLCRTFSLGRHRYDSGAHRFHDRDPQVTADLRELLGSELFPVSRPSKVLIGRRFLDFPPTPLNVILAGGVREVPRIGLDILRNRRRRGPLQSFEDFAVHKFGELLARQFLLNYSAKVWGLPPDRLSPAVATRRLRGMSLRTLVLELVDPSRKTAHLDGAFLYPRGGYGRIVEALASALPPEDLHCGLGVAGLIVQADRVVRLRLEDASEPNVSDTVVSTLPLTVLVRSLVGIQVPPAVERALAELRFRHVRLVFLRLKRSSVSPNASIYIPVPEYCISRIYEPRNRCETMAPPGETGLAAEVPCFRHEPVAALSAEELKSKVVRELVALGIIRAEEVLDWRVHELPNAYPVYALDFEDRVTTVLAFLRYLKNLEPLGRNGLFHYSHLHDQMRMARDLIASLTGDTVAATS